MDLSFNEEQEILRDSARKFLDKTCNMEYVRRMWEDEIGCSSECWEKMGDLGWFSLRIPEQYEGLSLGFVDLGIILEEMGRVAMPGPFLSTMLAAEIIMDSNSPEQMAEILPKIGMGGLKAAFALYEPDFREDASGINLSAKTVVDGFLINGSKLFVLDGCAADVFILAVRTRETEFPEQGITLFLLNADTPGVSRQPIGCLDGGRKQCGIVLENVRLHASQVLGKVNEGWPVLKKTLNKGAVAICLESIGGGLRTLQMAVDYAKIRVQFNQPIGSFQAIKHKCSQIMEQVESSRSIAYYAAWAIDHLEGKEQDMAVSAAKSYCSDMYRTATTEACQIFGAIGLTWEHDLHFYLKRAKMNEFLFGSPDFHRNQVVEILEY